MNPARSLAPAILSGVVINLWLYWSATFIGTSIAALVYWKRINNKKKEIERIDKPI
jgi:aquaporin Z